MTILANKSSHLATNATSELDPSIPWSHSAAYLLRRANGLTLLVDSIFTCTLPLINSLVRTLQILMMRTTPLLEKRGVKVIVAGSWVLSVGLPLSGVAYFLGYEKKDVGMKMQQYFFVIRIISLGVSFVFTIGSDLVIFVFVKVKGKLFSRFVYQKLCLVQWYEMEKLSSFGFFFLPFSLI